MKLNIGNTIKYLRKEKDITQDELADILGVSYKSVSRWETGTCYPDMELLPVISDFFGVTIDKLLGVDENIEREKELRSTNSGLMNRPSALVQTKSNGICPSGKAWV